jgi:hypothetical protein
MEWVGVEFGVKYVDRDTHGVSWRLTKHGPRSAIVSKDVSD